MKGDFMTFEFLLWGQMEWDFPLSVFLAGIAVTYSYLLKYLSSIRLYTKQPFLFFLALCLLYLIIGSPLSAISHLSFSLHMLQLSILYFIIPPLILAGIPGQLFKQLLKIPLIIKTGKLFLTPKLALFLFSLLFLIYHLPFVLRVFSQNPFMQNGFLLALFILSFILWWPIVSPDPNQRFYNKHKKRYIFLSGLLLMPACTIFIVSALIDGTQNPFLNQITAQLCTPTQTDSPNLLPSPFNTKYDQIMAGALMLGVHKFGMILSSRLRNAENCKMR
ncbi:cytochrome c oxidase assembly protein [Virgibacillus doumboii]|uniref:cytochrome c oxidase assembly protein n=1 Tax=Virgibacillus doumboii TaxID=2697503 RepID=UPI001FE9F788|nr:cytochrome c oxidase assembly protein [Virgibacillus doumboii]